MLASSRLLFFSLSSLLEGAEETENASFGEKKKPNAARDKVETRKNTRRRERGGDDIRPNQSNQCI